MNALTQFRHRVIRPPIAAALQAAGFLRDLRSIFRADPRHSNDEANAIRGLASLHPAIPRQVAKLRARLVDRDPAGILESVDGKDALFAAEEMQRCVERLKADGVYVFQERLPHALIGALQGALKASPAYLRTENGHGAALRQGVDSSGLFDIHEEDLMRQAAIQDYATNPTWLWIAGRYFGAPPVHDETVAWWTFPQSAEYASQNAQLFHSDRRRLSFVKFFTYLSDVTDRNGPHVVVPGSHRKRPFGLRRDRRYEDAEVAAGCRNAPLEVVGPAGTVIAVDTQALHKGKMLDDGHRLILEFQFATDLLGPPSPIIEDRWSEVAQARIRANPRAFQRFQPQGEPSP